MKCTVIHLITSLENGGAQEVMRTICDQTTHEYKHVVFYMTGNNAYKSTDAQYLSAATSLAIKGPASLVHAVKTVRNYCKSEASPICIQGWMYHANLLALLVKCVSPRTPILFGIHNGSDQRAFASFSGFVASRICALFSGLASAAVFVSHKAVASHTPYKNTIVISNPIKPLKKDGEPLTTWNDANQDPSRVTLACVARFDPIKNIELLLDVVQQFDKRGLPVRLLMAGEGMVSSNGALAEMIRVRNLEASVVLHGVVADVALVYKQADFTMLTSKCESFSNVLLESIACGTPFISSDVGIAEDLVSPESQIVRGYEISDWVAVMERKLQDKKTPQVAAAVRQFYEHVSRRYQPERIAKLYSNAWSKAAGR